MSQNKKRYWKGVEEFRNDPEFVKHAEKEFPEYLPINENGSEGNSRRDFLKMMGFGVAAASLAACEAPVRKAIPYLNKPVDLDPGIPNYYASTIAENGEYSSIVVKTREGRPIKIEGNELSKITQGGTSAQQQASVLSLYDKQRLTGPAIDGKNSDWETVDKEIKAKLSALASSGKKVALISNTIMSPTTLKAVEEFKVAYPNVEHITYDTQSASGMLTANEECFGIRVLPSYDFSKANTIVSIGADFLGTWISPVEFTKQYQVNRKLGSGKKSMSRHYQFETTLSLTGSNADYRTPIKPSQEGQTVVALYNAIASKAGQPSVQGDGGITLQNLDKCANELWSNKGKSLVVSGSNDPAVQTLVNGINMMLGNYSTTLNFTRYSNYRKGVDSDIINFVNSASSYGGVIFYNCNPVYNHAQGAALAEAISSMDLSVSTSDRNDETTAAVKYLAPANHFLESWGDAEPKKGMFSFAQPTISPIFNTRHGQESLLSWAGNNTSYYDYLKENWKTYYNEGNFVFGYDSFWDKLLHDGVMDLPMEDMGVPESEIDAAKAGSAIASNYSGGNYELSLYYKVGIGDGTQANNPWLMEMPDPISKGTWDNYLTMAIADATELGVTSTDGVTNMANLSVAGQTMKLPIIVQPGQAKGTFGIALGYGRTKGGRVANYVGTDANPLIGTLNGHGYFNVTNGVSVEILSETYKVAQTQTHETYMNRTNVIQESVLSEYQKDPSAGRAKPHVATWTTDSGELAPGEVSLWKGHKYPNHHWGLMVDLNSCTGCGACTVACQAENNIPAVGRDEVINRREMHWIRIDRYYSAAVDAEGYDELEQAADNPEVTFHPMMCQQCNNAPCETVCPVAATTHSTEGLNQMTYNRCIGTRYCANNCPYKVRRFNWFKYHDNKQFADSNTPMNNDLGKMVLNPDVTVRSRGVMEKCTFCVQRIQYGKLEAKKDGRRPKDGDINTACAQSCPANAIVFGDLNDANSKISQMLKIKNYEGDGTIDKTLSEPRAYTALEEIGVKPNVVYLTKIRNKEKETSNA